MSETDPTMRAALAMLQHLLDYEVDGSNPPDGRRVIRDERQTLHATIRHRVVGVVDDAVLRGQTAEGERVLAMWAGVSR